MLRVIERANEHDGTQGRETEAARDGTVIHQISDDVHNALSRVAIQE